jgi:aminoglycoside/choline kinase family phosphotransferase
MPTPFLPYHQEAALRLLPDDGGIRPVIIATEHLGHEWAPVTRLTFDRELGGIGRTVVVKTWRAEAEYGWGGPAHLRREHAALVTAEDASLAPRLIGADHTIGVLVASDLGTWPTLESVLLGDDPDAAAAAIVGLGRTVGRLHATTLNRGSTESHIERIGQWPGVDQWSGVEADVLALGLPDARVARDDIANVLSRLLEPSPVVLAHMDVHPGNALVTPDGVKLLDFEGSVFGHLGFDLASLHFPFPNYSAHWATVPPDVVAATDRAYRAELPESVRAGLDDEVAIGAAAALAVRVAKRLPKIAAEDQAPDERWRRRAQLVHQIRVFEDLAARAGVLAALADWYGRLGDVMAERWPDATKPRPPVFPAFVGR